jgi:hypothetical protein
VWVPAWIFKGRTQSNDLLILLEPNGRNALWHEGELYQNLAKKFVVCVPDLRGLGDLRPEYGAGSPGYQGDHQNEESYAWACLTLGSPLLGARVTDLLAVVQAARHLYPDARRVTVAANGHLTVPALCAAYLDTDISQLLLAAPLISWRSYAGADEYNHPFANIVPDILRHADLPQLAAALAPRRIALCGAVDAAGTTLPVAAARSAYSGSHIEVRKTADWDEHTFLYLL